MEFANTHFRYYQENYYDAFHEIQFFYKIKKVNLQTKIAV